jgi:predicted O-methyltransferase YrrM
MRMLFRPFSSAPGSQPVPPMYRYLRHPLFAWAGLRPAFAQHSAAEHQALQELARGKQCLVEIGVAEGASAQALREAMAPDGDLYLIDPFHLGRIPGIKALRRAAGAAVSASGNGRVHWIEKFSYDAVREWNRPIDLLFIDGDHSLAGVKRDWRDWGRFVVPGGVVLFHDARLFPGGWPKPEDGPVQMVDQTFRAGDAAGWKIIREVDSLVALERVS